jgi:hypothetical protein
MALSGSKDFPKRLLFAFRIELTRLNRGEAYRLSRRKGWSPKRDSGLVEILSRGNR